ncbi:TIGR01777 family oxidoreductase [Nocardioides aestuarii]|uniref:TIGR01777 family oxidoreductase n=1 Tax=Nocardioides aestuarii TaxID=252231 RepID=A0ABW4TSW0_9ACTN
MRVLLAGGSGFLGSHLTAHLRTRGHDVTRFVRRTPTGSDEVEWQPADGVVPREAVAAADVVVNLAGSPTAGNPHSSRWARELRDSRVTTTQLLAEEIAATGGRAALVAGNGISFYGDHGDTLVTEDSESRGDALLTRVTREWQAVTSSAESAGARVCVLRTAPVMDRRSMPLKALAPLFSLGLGGRLGSGRQHMPQISLRDWVGATTHLVEHETASGPFNLCCEQTPTNAEFTQALASALHRPAFLPAPAPVLRLAAGELAPELLGSVNARPAALLASGYEFRDPDVTEVVASGLARRDP